MATINKKRLGQIGAQNYVLEQVAHGLKPPSEEHERGKRDLYFLATEILGYKDVNKELHEDYCRFVSFQSNPRPKKLDLLPREHFKTTLGTVALAIQEIINDRDVTILVTNFTWGNARHMLEEIKEHLAGNKKLIKLYGEFVGSKWNEDEIIVTGRSRPNQTPTIMTAGVDKTLTSTHFKRIIHDDLVARENIGTWEQIQKVIKFYTDSLDLLDKKDGKLVIHGTRWAFYELYGWLLKNHSKEFDIYKRRAIENGKIIFPERFTKEILRGLKKEKGMADWACQYFNHVYDTLHSLMKADEVNYYTDEDYNEYATKYPFYVTMVIDGAVGETDEHCKTAITIVGTTIWDEWVYLDERVGHWGPTEALEEMVAAVEKWQPTKLGIQKTTFEKLYKMDLERLLNERKIYCPEIVELSKNPTISKHMQIMSLRPRIERKGLYWRPEHTELELTARQYPKTVSKDVLDSLSRHTEIAEVPFYREKHKARVKAFSSLSIHPERLPWNLGK